MAEPRVRNNADNTGIIYTTHDGEEVEILIDNFNPESVDISDTRYHRYDETSEIFQSEFIQDKSIIEKNFLEEPAPTFGLWDADVPVTTGSESTIPLLGTVKHYVATGSNGETIIVNVTEGDHWLDPGIVVRELYEDESGKSQIDESGVGTGRFSTLNRMLADSLWQENANRIGRESVYEEITGQQAPSSNTPPLPPPLPQYKPIPPYIDEAVVRQITIARTKASPLIIDLEAEGIELSSLGGGGNVYWDLDQDGMAEATAWVGPQDGLLALDRNNDGIVTDHSELFGTEQISGFVMLADFDSNGDGAIDAQDTVFENLIVWVDANTDGYSQADELHSLTDLNIAAINLNSTAINYQINGNDVRDESSYTMTDGTQHQIIDAWFAYDNVNTTYAQEYTLDLRTLFLPTIRGYGNAPDLHIAMSLDNGEGGLLEMVQIITIADVGTLFDPAFDLEDKIKDIMFHWAGVEDVNQNGRGQYIDGREVAFLEALTDQLFEQNGGSNPWHDAAATLHSAFNDAYNNIQARILVQTVASSSLFTEVATYNPVTDTFEGTFVLDLNAVANTISNLQLSGDDLVEAWGNMIRLIDNTVGLDNLSSSDHAVLEAMITDSDPVGALILEFILHTIYEPLGLNMFGSPGDDTLLGSPGNDMLQGREGNDTIYGHEGDDQIYGEEGNNHLYGEDGYDLVVGSAGDDYLDGGANDDTLSGGGGNDTFHYESGIDTIFDSSGFDIILFADGISPDQITVNLSDTNINDLYIYIDNTLAVRVEGFYKFTGAIEHLQFADGTIIDLSGAQQGTSGDDILVGTNDTFLDTLVGLDGNDILDGGLGKNVLNGGGGDDTYLLSSQDNTISDAGGNDRIVFGDGLNSTNFSYFYFNQDLRISFNGDLYVTIEKQFTQAGSIETLQFSDGVSVQTSTLSFDQTGSGGDDVIYGFQYGADINNIIHAGPGNDRAYANEGDDAVYGGGGNDNLYGSSGNDVLDGGAGNDMLDGGSGTDTALFSRGIVNYTLTNFGNLLLVQDNTGVEGSDTVLNNVEYFDFGGTILSFGALINPMQTQGNDVLAGTVNGDIYSGGEGNDILLGYAGDDILHGDSGADILDGGTGDDALFGDEGNDRLWGGEGGNDLDGGGGDDIIYLGTGNDIATGGEGKDLFVIQNGNLSVITDFTPYEDRVDLTNFDNVRNLSDLSFQTYFDDSGLHTNVYLGLGEESQILQLNNINYTDYIDFFSPDFIFGDYQSSQIHQLPPQPEEFLFGSGGNDFLFADEFSTSVFASTGNDHIEGGAGDDWLFGEDGNDTIYGGSGNNVLSGGNGFDTLLGGEGNDYFIFGQGETRTDHISDIGGADYLVMPDGVSLEDINFSTEGETILNIGIVGDIVAIIDTQFNVMGGAIEYIVVQNKVYDLNDAAAFGFSSSIANFGSVYQDFNKIYAQNDYVAADEDTVVTGNVFDDNGNGPDYDTNGLYLEVDIIDSQDADGHFQLFSNGDFIFSPTENANTYGGFQYTVYDADGNNSEAVISIQIMSVNDAPEARDDQFIASEDIALSGNLLSDNGSGVDSDIEGNPLSVTAGTFSTMHGGTVGIAADGAFTYNPAANFNGTDSFEYTLDDGQGGFDTGTASIEVDSVNDAPDAVADFFAVDEDSTLQGNVLSNNGFGVDRDLDSDSLFVIPADIITANGGSVLLLANGDFIYTPAANFNGPDGFEYTLNDGNGGQAVGTVSISVAALNDGPEAKNDQFVTNEDSALTGNLLSDNGNGADSDIDGNPLNVVAGTFATLHGGTIEVLENGQFTYMPAANFNGSDSFDYTLSDGQGGSDIATASILVNSVNDSPDAKDDLFTGTENHEIEGNLLTDNGFGVDIDLDGNVLRVVQDMVSSTAGGSVILMANGDFVYMPPSGFVGTDTFDYTVTDDLGGSASATVAMTINPALNIDPVAQDDQFETTLLSSITGNVLIDNDHGADSDIDGDTLSVQPAILFTEHGGMVSINADGGFVYTPATGFIGNDRFDYTVLDGQGGQDIGTVTVAVSAQPDQIIGTFGNDVLKGDNHDNTILAMAGNDTLKGKNGADLLVGGEGNDILYGSNGNDILVGGDVLMSQRHFSGNNVAFPNLAERVGLGNLAPPGTPALGVIDGDLTSAAATTATITFLSTGAGYNNSLGVYNIGADGTIQNVELAFTNVKKAAAGSAHTVELPGAPDSDFGFFIIADGARQNNDFKKLDLEHGDLNFYYHFGQADERLAKVTDDGDDLSLVFTHGNKETIIRGDVYHTTERGADPILNADEHTHAVSGFTDASDTTNLRIGFEDLRNTGDADYNDVVFDLSYAPTFTGTTTPDGNDILHGGNGDDLLIGGKGNDTLYGDKGADTFKFLSAEDGTDTIKDFRLSQGDKIDIAEVLEDYDPVSDILSQFVEVTQQGRDTVLSVDSDGGGDNFVALAIIQGNTHLDLQAMVSNGNLII